MLKGNKMVYECGYLKALLFVSTIPLKYNLFFEGDDDVPK